MPPTLEYKVEYNYSLHSTVDWAVSAVQRRVHLPFSGETYVQAQDTGKAQQSLHGKLERRIKEAIAQVEIIDKNIPVKYKLSIGRAVQLEMPSRIGLLQEYMVKGAGQKFQKLQKYLSEFGEVEFKPSHFMVQLTPLLEELAQEELVQSPAEADAALHLVFGRIDYELACTVGPDTQSYGYAGNARVSYVDAGKALSLAGNKARLSELIQEKLQEKKSNR